jgi:hypothetical protein
MNPRPLGYESSGTVQHSPVPCGFVQYRPAAGGTFRQAVSTHAKAVRLQQASHQLAGAPGQRGDQPREPGWAADCGACSDNDGDTTAGHDEVAAHIQLEVSRQLEELGERIREAVSAATQKVIAEFDRFGESLLGKETCWQTASGRRATARPDIDVATLDVQPDAYAG